MLPGKPGEVGPHAPVVVVFAERPPRHEIDQRDDRGKGDHGPQPLQSSSCFGEEPRVDRICAAESESYQRNHAEVPVPGAEVRPASVPVEYVSCRNRKSRQQQELVGRVPAAQGEK